jgi:hypothetical protein
MPDPFSIIVATAGLLDVCFRLASYLVDVKAAAAQVDGELATLSREIDSIILVNQSLGEWARESQTLDGLTPKDSQHLQSLWQHVATMVQGCRERVEKLEALMRGISGKKGHKFLTKLDGIKKQLRKQSKEKEFVQVHRQLSTYHANLQLLLTMIST